MSLRIARRVVVASTALCMGCGGEPVPQSQKPEGVPDSLRAMVERVDLVHQVAPGETLRVRVRGVVGPDGSWALDETTIGRTSGRIVISPRIRRVAGEAFIQMVIPLDVTVPLVLEPGRWEIAVEGRGGAPHVEPVLVMPGARRALPVVALERGDATAVEGGWMLRLRARATVEDGWVARLEVRGWGTDPAVWRDPGTAMAEGGALVADIGVLRPARDPARRIEARAVDGQGALSAVCTLDLPALSE